MRGVAEDDVVMCMCIHIFRKDCFLFFQVLYELTYSNYLEPAGVILNLNAYF